MLYVFMEGPDDERYFEAVYGDFFRERFGGFLPVLYAREKQKKINGFLNNIPHMPDSEYIFFGDTDGKSLEERKSDLIGKYTSLSVDRVFVVQFEIESWYYAGVDEASCKAMDLKHYEYRTDALTKEDLYAKLPSHADRVALMMEMLNHYSIPLAMDRNHSFRLFHQSMETGVS